MDLPNYFLADLPEGGGLTESLLRDACSTLRANRAKFLQPRSTQQIIRTLANVATDWLDPSSPFRQMALWEGPRHTYFSKQTIERGIDQFFKEVTPENLHRLVVQEFGHPDRLDQFCANDLELKGERASFARGPELLLHIAGGRLPNPSFASIIQGFLVRSAQFLKCATGMAFLPRLLAHSIHELDPKLASCLEIAVWKGGNEPLENLLFNEADCITATGSDETLQKLRSRLPPHARFLGYGHRVSFSYVCREILSGMNPAKFVARAARDIVDWNQMGCLSPHVIYVETAGKLLPEKFAEMLAGELANLELLEPRGELPPGEAAAIATRRSFYELRRAASSQTRLWTSQDSTAWTVVFEEDPRFQISCGNRFVYVKAVADPAQAMAEADPVRRNISTLGLAAPENRAPDIARQFAQWGVIRVCELGQMQSPSLLWRHDGRPSLGDLVTWADWENFS